MTYSIRYHPKLFKTFKPSRTTVELLIWAAGKEKLFRQVRLHFKYINNIQMILSCLLEN